MMPDNDALALVPLEELVAEIKRRHDAGVLLLLDSHTRKELTCLNEYWGVPYTAWGLAESFVRELSDSIAALSEHIVTDDEKEKP